MPDTTQVKELTEKLEQGIKNLFQSESYAEYLKTMSRFHKYSTRNTMLIHMQRPDASLVAGYSSWQTKFGRYVKKGEKHMKIFAPVPIVTRTEKEKIDPSTKQPIIGVDGLPEIEYIEKTFARFKAVKVFDVKQTDGKPLPTLVHDLAGNVEQYEAFMDALRAISPLPISIEALPNDTDGVCHFGDRIAIREGMSEIQTVCAAIHEITHAKLHDIESLRLMDETATPKDRRTEEVEAESVSYVVCQHFNIETGANSFGYVMEWSKDRELKELNNSLDTIRKTAAGLIDDIDVKFKELVKERNITLTAGEMEIVQTEPVMVQALDADSTTPDKTNFFDIIAEYARHAEVADTQRVGATVLLPPVFDDGNFNRGNKRIRVTVEEPIGKYSFYSREELDRKNYYFLTASGMIDRASQYFQDTWDEEQHKWVATLPTEAEIDELLPKIAARFEQDMANPGAWARYDHAAVLNRIAECEAHNIPVRELRNAESEQRRIEEQAAEEAEQQQKREKFDARVDEIAKAIENGEEINVGHDDTAFDGKNPVLDLFKLYGISLPLRTQGWVNTGLAAITGDSYKYYSGKNKGDSTTFSGYLKALREAIAVTPIEQKRQTPAKNAAEIAAPPAKKSMERKLYEKFANLFPQFAAGEYNHLRLNAGDSFMPLSLEWLNSNLISVMHTFELNGELCYDPMIVFRVGYEKEWGNEVETLTAVEFEQSNPPLYQTEDTDGRWTSVDGNGNEKTVFGLQKEINDFSLQWFENISVQGYMPERGKIEIDGKDVRVTFDENGKPIMPDPEKPPPMQGMEDNELYEKFAAMFPEFMNREYSTLRLEAEYAKPLELNWVFGDWISIAHTYELDGEPAFEPLVMFTVNTSERTVSAQSLDLSEPQRKDIVYRDSEEPDWEMQKNIHKLTSSWLDRAAKQNFKPVEATIVAAEVDVADIKILFDENGKPITPKSEAVKITELDMSLPDPSIQVSAMHQYGYTGGDMLPLTNGRAAELFDSDHCIYLLYSDGSETMAIDRGEITNHDGICGIERGDWEHSPVRAAQMAVAQNSEGSREAELLHGTTHDGMFGIYQIHDGTDKARNLCFTSMRELEALGLGVERANYKLVHIGPLPIRDTLTNLHKIYKDFNDDNRPADYAGRSVSVSDIIVLQWRGNVSSHYVDSTAFVKLDSFLGEEHKTRPSITKSANPPLVAYSQLGNSTAELKNTINGTSAGKLTQRLEAGKRQASVHGQPDEPKPNERRDIE